MDQQKQEHHSHKARKAGRGAKEKKKDKAAKKAGTRTERHNNRAFSVANIGRTQRGIQRNLDTAAPISAARGIPITHRPPDNPGPRLAREGAGRSVLWVGNKPNIQAIWDSLMPGGPPPLDYGDLAILRRVGTGPVSVERVRFGPD